MSTVDQGTKCRRNIAENYNRLSRVHERYRQTDRRQTTDGRATAYSEREREFTFANEKRVRSAFVADFPSYSWSGLCPIAVEDLFKK